MAPSPFQQFVSAALYVADRGNGSLEQSEIQALLKVASRNAKRFGLGDMQATREAVEAARSYISLRTSRDADSIHADFDGWLSTIMEATDPQDLASLYGDLHKVASSNGQMELGDKQVLQTIRERWAVQVS